MDESTLCLMIIQSLDGGVLLLGLPLFFVSNLFAILVVILILQLVHQKLFGFELMSNFRFPYFSRDIVEFWRRWHISLSTWFRDYMYIPLGGSKVSKWLSIRNIFIIFIVRLLMGFGMVRTGHS